MIRKLLVCALLLAMMCAPALAEEARAVLDPRVQPAVALSFDDGPTEFTQQVLDVLAENDCRATFFMVGVNMKLMPEMVKAVYDSGNEVGLHTWKHNDLSEMSANAVANNLNACQAIVLEQTGTTARWLRPPYGKVGPGAYGGATQMDMYIATWSVDSRDWSLQNAEKIYNEVMSQVRNGDILLFHDSHAATVEALKIILPELKARGFQVLTVDELMSFRETLRSGTHYYHLDLKKLRPMEESQ